MVNLFSIWTKRPSFYMWLFMLMFLNPSLPTDIGGLIWYMMYVIINVMLLFFENKFFGLTPERSYIEYWRMYEQYGNEVFKTHALEIKEIYNL
mgnify:CR=1 FL=1